MKKNIALLLCLILFVFAFVGCGASVDYVGRLDRTPVDYAGRWDCTSVEMDELVFDGEWVEGVFFELYSDSTGIMEFGDGDPIFITWKEVSGGIKIYDSTAGYSFDLVNGDLHWDYKDSLMIYEKQ